VAAFLLIRLIPLISGDPAALMPVRATKTVKCAA
jgi:hypothetical protein